MLRGAKGVLRVVVDGWLAREQCGLPTGMAHSTLASASGVP